MIDLLLKHSAKTIALILVILYTTPAIGQSQRIISYQGAVTGANNLPLTGDHTVSVAIYTTDTGGTPIFQEEQKITFNSDGTFNYLIGKVLPLPPLAVTNPATDRYYLGVQIDLSPELVPRSPFSDVTRAFFADTAGFARNALNAKSALYADSASNAKFSSYADTALYARAVNPAGLNIVPTTVNGLSNAVTLAGGGGTTVTTKGDTIAITSTELPGIQELQNYDGTLTIFNPNGPTTGINIGTGVITAAYLANGAVTNPKLANDAVTINTIGSGTAGAGEVVAADGSGGAVWQPVTASVISLPYVGIASSSSSIFSLTNTGIGTALSGSSPGTSIAGTTSGANGIGVVGTTSDGGAGIQTNSGVVGTSGGGFGVSGLTNTGNGIYASAATTGVALHAVTTASATSAIAGLFENLGSNATGTVLKVNALGTGSAGAFTVNNSANSSNALSSVTNGTGSAGFFQSTGTTSTAPALEGTTGSTAAGAKAVFGWTSNTGGTGTGVYGQAEGQGANAIYGLANNASGNGIGVYGQTNGAGGSAAGIYGWAENANGGGYGVWGQAEGVGADAIVGLADNTSGNGVGIYGWSRGATGVGMYGQSDGTTTGTIGVFGVETNTSATSGTFAGVEGSCTTPSANAYGVFGQVLNSGPGRGVYGLTGGTGAGVYGQTSGTGNGVYGVTSNSGSGVYGQTSGTGSGVFGISSNASGYGIQGQNTTSSGVGILGLVSSSAYAVWGYNESSGTGVYGYGGLGVQGATSANGGYGVYGTASGGTGEGVFGTTGSTSGTGTGVYALAGGTSATSIGSSNALIANYGGSGTSTTTTNNIAIFTTGSTREFRFANNGQAYTASGGAWNSGGADLAEAFEVIGTKSEYGPGDVLVLSATATYHVAKCTTPYSTCVAGVYATSPGVLLGFNGVDGDTVQNNAKVPMGVIGVLPTKVSGENGPIEVGDLLVTSSTPGHAMKGDPDKLHFGNILGKAMEPFHSTGTGVIKVLVGKY